MGARLHQPEKQSHIILHSGRAIRWILHSGKPIRVGQLLLPQRQLDCQSMTDQILVRNGILILLVGKEAVAGPEADPTRRMRIWSAISLNA